MLERGTDGDCRDVRTLQGLLETGERLTGEPRCEGPRGLRIPAGEGEPRARRQVGRVHPGYSPATDDGDRREPVSRARGRFSRQDILRFTIPSAIRRAPAAIVRLGLTPPEAGKVLPSVTKRLSSPRTRPVGSTGASLASLPIRRVPTAWENDENGPDVGSERSRRAEDLPGSPHERLQPAVVGLPVAVLDLNSFHSGRVRFSSQIDPVVRVRFVLRDAQEILEPMHEWLPQEGAGDPARGSPDHIHVRGVDVLDDSHRKAVPLARFFVEVGETDLLVENLVRVRPEGEQPGDHRIAVPHEEPADRKRVRAVAGEAGPEEDRRAAESAGGKYEEGRLEGNRLARSLVDAFGADHPGSPGPKARNHDAGADRESLPFRAAQDSGGVVLGVDRAGETVAGVAAHALRLVRCREVDGQGDRKRPETEPFARPPDAFGRCRPGNGRERVGTRPRGIEGIRARGAVDTEQPLRTGVEGLQLVVVDWPAGEVAGTEPEGRAAVEHRHPADGFVHRDRAKPAVPELPHRERRFPTVAEVAQDRAGAPVTFVPVRPAPALEDQHPGPGLAEPLGGERSSPDPNR